MWPYPRIVAHRCGGKLAPENTLAALRCGLAHGFHAVEFDVMLAQDGVPVVVHDPSFGRTILGAGKVSDFSAQALCGMDAGSWFGSEYAGEPVPLFRQVIDFCRENGIWMDVEIKPAPGFDAQTGRVVAQMVRQRLEPDAAWLPARGGLVPAASALAVQKPPPPLLTSFSFDALMAAKLAAPDIARAYLVDVIPADWLQRLAQLDSVILQTNHENLTPALVQKVKQAGVGLFCYTVNTPERAREILRWGVDGFCTDRIDLIGPDFQ